MENTTMLIKYQIILLKKIIRHFIKTRRMEIYLTFCSSSTWASKIKFLVGNSNLVQGSSNNVSGDSNVVQGTGNIVKSSGSNLRPNNWKNLIHYHYTTILFKS